MRTAMACVVILTVLVVAMYIGTGECKVKVQRMKEIAADAEREGRIAEYERAKALSKAAGELSIFEGGIK